MAEVDRYMFSLREVAQALLKTLDIHEGLWGISIEFGLAAQNVPLSPDGKTISPAGITLVQKVGIQRFKEPNNLTLDAAEVSPVKTARRSEGRRATSKRAKK